MERLNVNPTRMELTNLKKKLITARRGHKLLKDKRDELMRRFMEKVRENKELRIKVEEKISDANKHMAVARSVMSDNAIEAALMMPMREIDIDIKTRNVMSVNIPEYKINFNSAEKADIYSYGFAYTSIDLDESVNALADILPDLMKLAETEKACQLMASEIEKTRRRVNALEHVMIPRYEETIKYISMKLEENERGATTRNMKVKDMLLKQAHGL